MNAQITGHIRLEPTGWFARYRTVDVRRDGSYGATQKTKKLGKAWTGKGRPPAGFVTERMAQDDLVRILDAERARVAGGRPIVVTFRQAAEEWKRYAEHDRRVRASTLTDYKRTADALAAHFGDAPLESITAQDIEAYKTTIVDKGRRGTGRKLAPRTINRHLTICGGIFRRAERKWGIRHNPAAGAEKLSEKGSGRLNFLTPEELGAVVAAAGTPDAATLYLVAGMTGLRLGELLALRWRHVDFVTERVVVERSLDLNERVEQPTKSYKTRSVGLAAEVLTALAQHKNRTAHADDGDLVFAAWNGSYLDDGEVRSAFYAALAAAGLGHKRQGSGPERFTFHNLRHTFGTTLARGSVDVHRIQRLMGHAHISTTLVYMHYAPSKDEGAQISAAFAGAFEIPRAGLAELTSAA